MTTFNQIPVVQGFVNVLIKQRSRAADCLLMLATWLTQLAYRLSPQKKPYRGFAPLLPHLDTAPYHPALIASLGNNKALILHKLWEWQESNRRDGKNLRGGHHWTYDTYETWQEKHFSWISVDYLRKLICEMERDGLLISGQFSKGSAVKWYRVDVQAVSKRVQAAAKTSARTVKSSAPSGESVRMGGEKDRTITKENTKKNQQIKNTKAQTTAASASASESQIETQIDPQTAVAVVATTHSAAENTQESGEHNINGEVSQHRQDTEREGSFAFEAPINQHANNTAPSKVPPKVPADDGKLRAELIRFGVLPHTAARLIDQYGEADARKVLAYAQGQGTLGPGFVVDELKHKRFGVLAMDDQQAVTFNHSLPTAIPRFTAPDGSLFTDDEREEIALIGFDRFMALRQMNQSLQSDPNFEYA